jgi:hypothetical protein
MTQAKDKDSLKVHYPARLKAGNELFPDIDPGNSLI